jgi:ABC-type polysaccharide/polyol phosphate export permease
MLICFHGPFLIAFHYVFYRDLKTMLGFLLGV